MAVGLIVGGRYELLAQLGHGGYGTVWRAHDRTLRRDVAVKLISVAGDQRDAVVERFWREAHAVASLNHPNIVIAHDFGVHDDHAYLVMELIAGGSLADELAERRRPGITPLEIRRVLAIGTQVSAGLAAAHAAGLVHRDLKPANLMVVRPSGDMKIVDFGIARSGDLGRLTATGDYLGTLPYASPEQMNPGDVDGRSDLYSLGCVLFELLTGRSPYDATSPAQWISAHQSAAPIPLRRLLPSAPVELERLIADLLAKDPARRPSGAAAVRARLDRVGAAPAGPVLPRRRMDTTYPGAAPFASVAVHPPPVRPSPVRPSMVVPRAVPPGAVVPIPYGWRPVSPNPYAWTTNQPPRPATTTVAGRMLMAFAVCCAVEAVLAGATVASLAQTLARVFVGVPNAPGGDVVGYLMFLAVGWSASTLIVGLVAGSVMRGRVGGRIWWWILAFPYAFFCFAGLGTGSTLATALTPHGGDAPRPRVGAALTDVRAAIPHWAVTGMSVFSGLGLVLVVASALLLTAPQSGAYIRARRAFQPRR